MIQWYDEAFRYLAREHKEGVHNDVRAAVFGDVDGVIQGPA